MRNTTTAAALLLGFGLLFGRAAAADDKPTPPPPPPPETTETEVLATHMGPTPDTTPRRVRIPVAPETVRPAAPARPGPLTGLRALALQDGEARLQLADGPRTVHPGDLLGTDVVKLIGDGTMVLERPEVPGRPGGAGTVVLRFDAQGRPSVSVFYESDPAPVRAPEVAR